MATRIAAFGVLLAIMGPAATARAQGGLSAAVLQLANNAPPGVVRPISGERLYGGIVCATIIDGNTKTNDFAAQDNVAFTIVPRGSVTTAGVCPASGRLQFLAPGNPDPTVAPEVNSKRGQTPTPERSSTFCSQVASPPRSWVRTPLTCTDSSCC
jgi:hypothetical protein